MALPGLSCQQWGRRSNRAFGPSPTSGFLKWSCFLGRRKPGRSWTLCQMPAPPRVPICKMGTLTKPFLVVEAALDIQADSTGSRSR